MSANLHKKETRVQKVDQIKNLVNGAYTSNIEKLDTWLTLLLTQNTSKCLKINPYIIYAQDFEQVLIFDNIRVKFKPDKVTRYEIFLSVSVTRDKYWILHSTERAKSRDPWVRGRHPRTDLQVTSNMKLAKSRTGTEQCNEKISPNRIFSQKNHALHNKKNHFNNLSTETKQLTIDSLSKLNIYPNM